jgi:hypothetical protein
MPIKDLSCCCAILNAVEEVEGRVGVLEVVAERSLQMEEKGICTEPATNSAKVGPSALDPPGI